MSTKAAPYAGYRNVVHRHLIPRIGRTFRRSLPSVAERSRAGLRPRTVQWIRAVLRRALGHAVEWELIGRNAAVSAKPPRQRRYQAHGWTPEQMRRFLTAVRDEDDRWAALYTAAAYLGLRQGEILGLTWADST